MPLRKPRANRRVVKKLITLDGGPLDTSQVGLDAHGGFTTLPIAAMKGFPPGRYINATWTPDA